MGYPGTQLGPSKRRESPDERGGNGKNLLCLSHYGDSRKGIAPELDFGDGAFLMPDRPTDQNHNEGYLSSESVNVGRSASIHEPNGSPIVDSALALRPVGHVGRPGRCLVVAWRIGGYLHWAPPRGSDDPCAPMGGLADGTSGLRSARSR